MKQDVEFLQGHNLMDYSLLLCVERNILPDKDKNDDAFKNDELNDSNMFDSIDLDYQENLGKTGSEKKQQFLDVDYFEKERKKTTTSINSQDKLIKKIT